jgi:hypothetical protein
LRRGLPPAVERPPKAWPSIRVWPIIIQCWNSNPHSRPSAFTAMIMLRRTALTFPTNVIKRIVHFVDITWSTSFLDSLPSWQERCQCLRHLCLASRAFRECATPFLYREIRLVLNDGRPLSALISTLDSSTTTFPLAAQEPAGYGSYTRFIFLSSTEGAIPQADFAVGIRNLTGRLLGLRLAYIYSPSF